MKLGHEHAAKVKFITLLLWRKLANHGIHRDSDQYSKNHSLYKSGKQKY